MSHHLKPPVAQTRQTDRFSSRDFLFRFAIFTILQTGSIALAGRGLMGPLILSFPSRVTFDEAKGGFTIIAIVWHALATMVVRDVALQVFSSEWFALYQRTGCLESGATDRVSRLTTGLLAQARHLISRVATMRYRLSMMMWLLLIAIGGVGPSTISVTKTSITTPTQIALANVTLPIFDTLEEDFASMLLRANTILRLEVFEKVTFGYNTSDNAMIPWPATKPGGGHDQLTYRSDVLSFDFTCSWHQPIFKNWTSDNMVFWTINNHTFVNNFTNLIDESQGTSRLMRWPTSSFDMGWLFVSFNPSIRNHTVAVDLGGLPTTDLQTDQYLFPDVFQTATALICNSHINLTTADVALADGVLTATPIQSEKVGNFQSSPTVQCLFLSEIFSSLIYSFPDSVIGTSSRMFNSVSRLLFFCEEDDPCDAILKPLPLPIISDNMNRFFRSATKTFLDGFNGTRPGYGTISLPNFNTFTTTAMGQDEKLALTTSRPFFIVLAVVVGSVEFLLVILFFVIDMQYMRPFSLDNILHATDKFS